jgi:DNA-binding NarL/FixJ family response regulator
LILVIASASKWPVCPTRHIASPHMSGVARTGGVDVHASAPRQVTRVAILVERRLFRDAIACCLAADPDFSIVGHAASAHDLLDLCELRPPDVVLLSVVNGVETVLKVLIDLRDRFVDVRAVVVYEHLSSADLDAIWQAGVDNIVPASNGLDALRAVLRNPKDGPRPARTAPSQVANAAKLTDREQEILALLGGGHTVSRIAELLEISTHAVENDKRRIYRKLDVASQSHAVARAAALGILNGSPGCRRVDTRTETPLVILRGLCPATNERAATAMLTAGVPFSIENPMPSHQAYWWDAWHRSATLLVLVEPATADRPSCGTARLPVVLVQYGTQRQVGTMTAPSGVIVPVVAADRVTDDLVPAINLAAQESHRFGAVDAWIGWDADPAPEAHRDHLPELTARESDILHSIARGHSVRQTARWLGIAAKTVENTQARLFRKLGARNRAGALAIAHGIGLVDPTATVERPAGSGSRRAGVTHPVEC